MSEKMKGEAGGIGRRLMFLGPLGLLAAGGAGAFVLLQRLGEGTFDPRGVPSALIDKPAPPFILAPQANHTNFTPADLAGQTKPVLINIFASWCLPCIAEAPQLLALQKRGVAIWGIAYKDKEADTARFLQQHGNPYARIGRDPEGKAGMEFGVYGVPETYLIDKAGIVRWRGAGALTDGVGGRGLDTLLAKYA